MGFVVLSVFVGRLSEARRRRWNQTVASINEEWEDDGRDLISTDTLPAGRFTPRQSVGRNGEPSMGLGRICRTSILNGAVASSDSVT